MNADERGRKGKVSSARLVRPPQTGMSFDSHDVGVLHVTFILECLQFSPERGGQALEHVSVRVLVDKRPERKGGTKGMSSTAEPI